MSDVDDQRDTDRPNLRDQLSCAQAHDLISSAADDELAAAEHARLAMHLDGCPSCAAYGEEVAALTRAVRLRPLVAPSDFVETVMVRAGGARLGRGAWIRPALAWCGIVVGAQAVPPLLFADMADTPTHVARHVGAFALALAIGFLYVAWRPHRAAGMLPFVSALIATTIFAALLDTTSGARSALAESTHLAELIGLVLLWMVAGSPGWERLRRRAPSLGRAI